MADTKTAAFEWLKDMDPIHRALLVGAGGAALGGAALGGLRASRPLDEEEGETKAKRRSAVISQALLGALLGGTGGAAAGYLPKLLASAPPPLTPATDPNANFIRRGVYNTGQAIGSATAGHPLTVASAALTAAHTAPRAITFKRLLQLAKAPQGVEGEPTYSPGINKDTKLPNVRTEGHQIIQDAANELQAMPRWRRLWEQTGAPTFGRHVASDPKTKYDLAMTHLTGQTPKSVLRVGKFMRPPTAVALSAGIPALVNYSAQRPEKFVGELLRKGLQLK